MGPIRGRRFDEERGCYVYDISYPIRAASTPRAREASEAFGLGAEQEKVLFRGFELRLGPGDVVYITGESGSGKSALLRAIRGDLGEEACSLGEAVLDPEAPVVEQVGHGFPEAVGLLSRVGLSDATILGLLPGELSEGQRYRLRAAKVLASGTRFWLADEFCSGLDRVAARTVAWNLQRLARRSGACLVVAESVGDLAVDLGASMTVRKGWGDAIEVDGPLPVPAECSVMREVTIREGNASDYRRLSGLHYRGGSPVAPLAYYAAEHGGAAVGVVAYCYPAANVRGRREAVGYTPSLRELNSEWAQVSRVVVHPRFRGIGLGERLLRETLPRIGRRHIELVAAMAGHNPFAERAGMRKVLTSGPDPSVAAAVTRLEEIGFDPHALASEGRNTETLRGLGAEGIRAVHAALLSVTPFYYRRFTGGRPHTRRADFAEWLKTQPPEKLAHSISVLAVLNQHKAYLIWERSIENRIN